MANTICPYCGHNVAPAKLATGALKGAGIALASVVGGPIAGIAAGALAFGDSTVKAAKEADTQTRKCPNCEKYYPI